MQEKADNVSRSVAARRYTTKEERLSHVQNWKKSNLSMSEYCRQNNVALANLSEWRRSILRNSTQFKPVQSLPSLDASTKISNVVEIIVDQRIKIRFQHVSDASLIIKIAQGMLACS
jgi:transposase-like protein